MGSGKSKNSLNKRSKNEWQALQQASPQTPTDKRAAGRSWTHMKGRHAQGPYLTSMYSANIGRSEVMR